MLIFYLEFKDSIAQKGSFPLRISLVNMDKSVENCKFVHIY